MIRNATPHDLVPIVELGKIMHAESPRLGKLRYVPAKVAYTMAGLINNPNGLLLVAEENGEIIGGMAARLSEHWYSDQAMAHDIALFIRPENRGGMAAPRLLTAYKKWASDNGAVITQFGVSTGVNLASTSRLLDRLDFAPAGFIYDAKG